MNTSTLPLTARTGDTVTHRFDHTHVHTGLFVERTNADQGYVLWDDSRTPSLEWLDELKVAAA
jgi:hypothetical protein